MSRHSRSLAAQAVSLSIAAPQVIAHRMLNMTHEEFHRMGAEKFAAFGESWTAMMLQGAFEAQQMAFSFMLAVWFPWLAPRHSAARQFQNAALAIAGKGMAPVQRRAVANARRLGRLKGPGRL